MSLSPLAVLARTLDPLPRDGIPTDDGDAAARVSISGEVPFSADLPTARVAAAAVLLRPVGEGDAELVLTRRCAHLAHHPGQVAFPGGRVDPGETLLDAALREAAEEVALDPSTVRPLGMLPGFYIPPSRFWLHPVVLDWQRPHALRPAEAEVDEIFGVRISQLTDRRRLRVVQLSARGPSWAWELDDGRILWGATGVAVAALLDRLTPGWSAGATPAELGPQHLLAARGLQPPPGPRPARLARMQAPERTLAEVPRGGSGGFDPKLVDGAGQAVAAACGALLPPGTGRRVVVLTGPGGTGRVGVAAAAALASGGEHVTVVPAPVPGPADAEVLRRAGAAVQASGNLQLPPHDLVVDALLGRGFRPPLAGHVAELVAALRGSAALQLAVDLPTGLDPQRGPVGPSVAADVTVAIATAAPLLEAAGAEPFVGDCYLWRPAADARSSGAGGPAAGSGLERLLLR